MFAAQTTTALKTLSLDFKEMELMLEHQLILTLVLRFQLEPQHQMVDLFHILLREPLMEELRQYHTLKNQHQMDILPMRPSLPQMEEHHISLTQLRQQEMEEP